MVLIASGLDGCEALWWSPTGAPLRGAVHGQFDEGSVQGLLNSHT